MTMTVTVNPYDHTGTIEFRCVFFVNGQIPSMLTSVVTDRVRFSSVGLPYVFGVVTHLNEHAIELDGEMFLPAWAIADIV